MCFNDTDEKLWREDPHEYVRKGYGKWPSFIFFRNANFTQLLCRRNDHLMAF